MLTMLGIRLVNLDHVRDVEPLYDEPSGHGPEMRVTFVDGSSFLALGTVDDLRALVGRILPAPAGYVLIWQRACFGVDEDGRPDYATSPIVGFRLEGGAGTLVPVSMAGEPWQFDSFAVVRPDGTCESDGEVFESVDAWKALFEPAEPPGEAPPAVRLRH